MVGLVCLSVLGRLVSQQPPLENFSRFAPILSPTALFYPTASEVVALARNSASPDEILVIVGGSSVARGDGQSTGNLWSRRLEEQLGPPYRVVNLAMASGAMVEYGAIAAQALRVEGRRVIFVSDVLGLSLSPPDGGTWKYVFWDAYFKGLLLPDAHRDAVIARREEVAARTAEGTELRIRSGAGSCVLFHRSVDDVQRTDGFHRLGAYRRRVRHLLHAAARDVPRLPCTVAAAPSGRFESMPREQQIDIGHYMGSLSCPSGWDPPVRSPAPPTFWMDFDELAEAALPAGFDGPPFWSWSGRIRTSSTISRRFIVTASIRPTITRGAYS